MYFYKCKEEKKRCEKKKKKKIVLLCLIHLLSVPYFPLILRHLFISPLNSSMLLHVKPCQAK